MDLLEKELEAAKAAEFHKKSLRDLRTELNSAVGYAELGERHGSKVEEYLAKLRGVLTNMEETIAFAPGYYHFILMDIEMPVMDGYEATMKIRKLPNRIRANVPIIALTANAVPEKRERAAVVGMDDFLVKPTNSARLLRSLEKFL